MAYETSTPTPPAENAGERKSLRSISGAAAKVSRQTKAQSRTGAATAQATSGGDSPHARHSVIASNSAASAGTSTSAPIASNRRSLASAGVLGTISQAKMTPRTANGTVTQKIHRQPSVPRM